MTYWLDLFTGQTWQDFRDYGASVSGFRKRMRHAVERIIGGNNCSLSSYYTQDAARGDRK